MILGPAGLQVFKNLPCTEGTRFDPEPGNPDPETRVRAISGLARAAQLESLLQQKIRHDTNTDTMICQITILKKRRL